MHTIEKRKNIKNAVKKIDIRKKKLTCIKKENGSLSYNKQRIADRFSEYYSDQFSFSQPIVNTVLRFQKVNDKVPSILKSEVQRAKNHKLTNRRYGNKRCFKAGGDTIVGRLTELYKKGFE